MAPARRVEDNDVGPSIEAAALAAFDPEQVKQLGDLIASTAAGFRELLYALQAATSRLELLNTTIACAVAEVEEQAGVASIADNSRAVLVERPTYLVPSSSNDGLMCSQCGGLMRRTGTCYTCESCGFNDGCG